VCSEVITMALRGPSETHIGNLVGQAIFGDAASAACQLWNELERW